MDMDLNKEDIFFKLQSFKKLLLKEKEELLKLSLDNLSLFRITRILNVVDKITNDSPKDSEEVLKLR